MFDTVLGQETNLEPGERWVGTIRRECLDRMLIFSERQLVRVLAEYETHYNGHRPHRALDQRAPIAGAAIFAHHPFWTAVRRDEVLGGLINGYLPRRDHGSRLQDRGY